VRYLLDTNHWSYLQEKRPAVVARVRELPDEDELLMSVVSQAELLAGVQLVRSDKRRAELAALYRHAIAAATEVIPITSPVAEEFASILAELRDKGRPIETNDIWIAATARSQGLIVATSDPDFQHVDGLQLEDWTQAKS